MREAASPGIAGRSAREMYKTSPLEKQGGVWPVALERLPARLLGAVFGYYLPVCGLGAPCIPGIILLTKLYKGAASALGLSFHQAIPEELQYIRISQSDLMFELTSLAA